MGVTLGCFLANLFGSTILDVVFGTLATLIAAVMDEFSTERLETEENIRAILERKYPMAREDEKVRRRAVAALQRYGYGFDEIFSVLNSEE